MMKLSDNAMARLAATLGFAVVGSSTFNVLPLLTSGASVALGFSEAQVGIMSVAITVGSGIAAALAGVWVRSLPWRPAAFWGLIGMLAANSLAMADHRMGVFMLAQGAAGFFSTSVFCLAMTMLSDHQESARTFGIAGALQVAFQIAVILAGPTLLKLAGLNGILAVLVAMSGIALFFVPLLPSLGRATARTTAPSALFKPATLIALTGFLIFFVNVGAYWTYIELMGQARGFTARMVANGLAIGISAGFLGCILASALGDFIGRLWPIVIGALLTISAALLVSGPFSVQAFVISGLLYFFAWNYAYVYQLAIINAVDATGRAVAISQAFGYVGGSTGAAVAAAFLRPGDYSAVVWIAIIAVCLSTAVFILASLLNRHALEGSPHFPDHPAILRDLNPENLK